MENTSIATTEPRILPIDVGHGAINLLVPLATVIGLILGFILTVALLNALQVDLSSLAALLPFVGAILGGLVVGFVAERGLKRPAKTRRQLVIDSAGLKVQNRDAETAEAEIRWDQHVNWLAWQFKVKRGTARVPRGWAMLSFQLMQDDALMTLYTFMPFKQAEALPDYKSFVTLAPRKSLEKSKLPLREISDQRRLLKAEDERWEHGAEIRREDFPALLTTVMQHLEQWQKS